MRDDVWRRVVMCDHDGSATVGLLDEIRRVSERMSAQEQPFGSETEDAVIQAARSEAVENSKEVVRAYQELIMMLSAVHQRARMSRDVDELHQVARYLAIADEHLANLLEALHRATEED